MNLQNRSLNSKKNGGYTLVELLIGVAIIAILIFVVLPIGQGLLGKTSASAELQAVTDTKQRIDTYRRVNNIDATLDNAFVIRNKLISTAYKINGTNIYNTFNKAVVFEGVDPNGLRMTSTVPSKLCVENVENAAQQGFDSVEIGGTALQYTDTTPDDRAQACEGAIGTSDTVDITFIVDASN